MLSFMCLFIIIIMSISVKRHKLWRTVRDMRFSKCSIIIILMIGCPCLKVASSSCVDLAIEADVVSIVSFSLACLGARHCVY